MVTTSTLRRQVYLGDADGENDSRDIIWGIGWIMPAFPGFCPEFEDKLINLSCLSQSELGFLSLECMSLNW